jgi:hypothetical protein
MYLYVSKKEALTKVPEALLTLFGSAELAMTMLLKADKVLARVDAKKVLTAIDEQGYFLQMPPADEYDEMSRLAEQNSKLQR